MIAHLCKNVRKHGIIYISACLTLKVNVIPLLEFSYLYIAFHYTVSCAPFACLKE